MAFATCGFPHGALSPPRLLATLLSASRRIYLLAPVSRLRSNLAKRSWFLAPKAHSLPPINRSCDFPEALPHRPHSSLYAPCDFERARSRLRFRGQIHLHQPAGSGPLCASCLSASDQMPRAVSTSEMATQW